MSALQFLKITSSNKEKEARGFTLLELLVVIAIIGLMVTIVLAFLANGRRKSRDARRIADIKQLENSIALYVNENKVSPATLQALAPTYISSIPPEPGGAGKSYGYVSLPSGGFVLGAILETAGQAPPLNNDYDGSQAITINGSATDCNALTGAGNEVVYCLYSP